MDLSEGGGAANFCQKNAKKVLPESDTLHICHFTDAALTVLPPAELVANTNG
jgi:hypothetical protein